MIKSINFINYKSVEDLSDEVLEKCKFVVEIFEMFINPYKNIQFFDIKKERNKINT